MTRRAVLLALLAAPAVVGAQTLTPTSGEILFPSDDEYIGKAECEANAQMKLSWLADLGGNDYPADPTYAIYASNDSACDGSTGGLVRTVRTGISGNSTSLGIESYPATASDLTANDFIGAPLSYACTDGLDRTIYVCVRLTNGNAGPVLGEAFGSFELQLRAPAAPAAPTVTPGDERLYVSWTAVTGTPAAAEYLVEASTGGTVVSDSTATAPDRSTTVRDLSNGVTYQVTVRSVSVGGNASDPSPATEGTPAASDDFWEHYRNQGGQEEGGCSTGGGGGALAGVALLALGALRRRRS